MKTHHVGLSGGSILQLRAEGSSQKMGYIVTAPNGEVIVIDGGKAYEADRMRELLREKGGRVSLWLLTHCHSDHIETPADIIADPQGLVIDKVCFAFPDRDWLVSTESDTDATYDRGDALRALPEEQRIEAKKGLSLTVGGVQIDCLTDPLYIVGREPKDLYYCINDSSAIFRFTFPGGKTALFLGDCGVWQGRVLLEEYGDALQADLCQMAHHGQNGAEQPVYEKIRPQLCFYDAPQWLWDNDRGEGFDTGPWKTVQTRRWMAALGCVRYAVIADGDNLVI